MSVLFVLVLASLALGCTVVKPPDQKNSFSSPYCFFLPCWGVKLSVTLEGPFFRAFICETNWLFAATLLEIQQVFLGWISLIYREKNPTYFFIKFFPSNFFILARLFYAVAFSAINCLVKTLSKCQSVNAHFSLDIYFTPFNLAWKKVKGFFTPRNNFWERHFRKE